MLFVLLWSILYFIFGEKISVNNGCGYDGLFYCTITQNFDTFILNKSFSAYYANRILPCGIIHFSLKLFGFSLTLPNILTGFYVLNTISWLTATVLWHKILNYYRVSIKVQWLMSVFILLNFYFLKFMFYYPVLTDSMAFLSGMMLLWFYIQDKVLYLVVTGFFGAFVYPLFAIYACILIVFSIHFKLKLPEKQSKTFTDYSIITFLLTVFVLFRMYVAYRINYVQSTGFHVNTLLYAITYGYVLYHILPSWVIVRANLKPLWYYLIQKRTFIRIATAVLLFFITTGIKWYISQNSALKNPENVYLIKSLLGIGYHGTLWITEYFSGFGLIAVFFILFLRKIYSVSINQGLGFYCIFFCLSVFLMRPEMRDTADIYAFFILAIALFIQSEISFRITKTHIFIFTLINLFLSKWYLPIEKSPLVFSSSENTWVYENFALSTYLMTDMQYAGMSMLFVITTIVVFTVFLQQIKR